MRGKGETEMKNSVGRMLFAGVAILLQIGWVVGQVVLLQQQMAWIGMATTVVALVLVLRLYAGHTNAALKMPWIMLILAFPVLGLALYLLLGYSFSGRRMSRRIRAVDEGLLPLLHQEEAAAEAVRKADLGFAGQCHYLRIRAGYPVYANTAATFYDSGAKGFAAQKEALRKAERFIFMEYHAVEDGKAFGELCEILQQRAAAGVEVRLIYDDVGSMPFVDGAFARRLEQKGIRCMAFNPVVPVLNVFMNHRDHRKITVIDNKVGFVGGYNLADEYFDLTRPYGVWKDSGLRLEGAAVRSLTAMFLEMWNFVGKPDENYGIYLAAEPAVAEGAGFVLPYADCPLDEERVGENAYLNLIKNAKKYLYLTTPYLIPSDEMVRELALAAGRGVDVRIITPGIPDKRLVYGMTRSYYNVLARQGVRIYEYTPGFCHAKQWVADDTTAIVGTINLDYRSLYLHFENAVLLYGCPAVGQVRQDFAALLPRCREVTAKYRDDRSTALRIGQCILRLFAPLL